MELLTLARPYAKAVFELARETKTLAPWSESLAALSVAVSDARLEALIGSPALSRDQLAELLLGVLDTAGLSKAPQWQQLRSLVRLLAENRRLPVAPTIAGMYEAMRAEAESRIEVEITTAVKVASTQADYLSAAISKRLARTVEIQWNMDENLLGGAMIRAGDLVIDGSLKGELQRLSQTLSR